MTNWKQDPRSGHENDWYFDGLGAADGFGHGHHNDATGYNRPSIGGDSIENKLGWTGVMGAFGKSNVDDGSPR